MITESQEISEGFEAVRVFPNLRSREIVKAIVEGIVDTCEHTQMTYAEQKVFALGYVRGAVTVLRQTGDHALPIALEILDMLNRGGLDAARTLAERVTGQNFSVAAE